MKNKLVAIIILICILTATVSAGLLYPRPTKAQFQLGLPTYTVEVGPLSFWQKAWNILQKALKTAGDIAYQNSLRYFLNRVAYDTATYIASGGAGQKPLFITNFGEYFKQTADEAGGVFFEKLTAGTKGYCENYPNKLCSEDNDCPVVAYIGGTGGDPLYDRCIGAWGGIGIDLCQPLSGQIKIDLTVAARKSLEPRKPSCNWTQVMKNIGDVRNMSLDQLVDFSTRFHPGANDLGAYLTIRAGQEAYVREQVRQSDLQAIIEGGYQSVTNPITKAILTPAKTVSDMLSLSTEKAFVSQETYTGSPVADAVGVFTNTLVSKLLERVFKKGFNPQESGVLVSDFWTLGGRQAARLFFGELAEVNYKFNISMSLDEFVIEGDSQFNGVINDQFSQAIEQQCTVGQAIGFYEPGEDAYRAECMQGNIGLISGTAAFGFDSGGVEPAVGKGIPFRSILVLRKFRVVPVGWGLAAQYYRDFDEGGKTLNLNYLTSVYNEPKIDGVANPYYRLIDPDWLLKFPATRCAKQGAGPQKIEQEPYCNGQMIDGECDGEVVYPFQRVDYCADYETCLDDTSGPCDANEWGYCVEEKPVWDIKGTECQKKYYATCQTMINSDTNQQVSYLLNTLSGYTDGVCDSSNAGCREYCEDYNSITNTWICSSTEYLNNQVEDCGPGNEGCHLFYSSASQDKSEVEAAFNAKSSDSNAYGLLNKNYTKLAPSYYHCEDYTAPVNPQPEPASSDISKEKACGDAGYFWRSDLKLCVQGGSDECANFVKQCEEDDANCNLYTPISNKGPAVPGTIDPKDCPPADPFCEDETSPAITWNDECPASCVGYQTYHQMDTTFEGAADKDFIAATGQSCSQPGCDKFTNLDEVARGGEGIEYYSYLRQCIKPEESGWSTYYTWEGDEDTGQQLRKWELKAGGDGGPYYLPDGVCDNLDDSDCREFFDANLKPFRRFFSKTISVSDDCHPFRRSGNTDRSQCFESNKNWTNGVCIYNAIPSQGIQCAASNAGCREYKSTAGYNYQKILESYFANSLENWSGNGVLSSESVRRDDNSLHISGSVQHDLTVGDLEEGKIYTLEFLAKGSGTASAQFSGGSQSASSNSVSLNSEWNSYSLKLPNNSQGLAANQINNNKLQINGNFYIDNIVLKKMDSLLLIKDSWTTPKECDKRGDTIVPGEHLNCEAYRDNKRKEINLRSFDNLCFEDVVGCELVIDSKNTSSLGDDGKDYLVLDKKYKCDQNNLGCTRLGLITPDRDDDTEYTTEDIYKIIDLENSLRLCLADEVFCQQYQDLEDNNKFYYFKDPLTRTCEYKKVGESYGWYKSGSEEECISVDDSNFYDEHCIGGVELSSGSCTNLASPSTNGLLSDWAGLCDSQSSGCLEYQDPQEPEECDRSYVNYEYLYDGTDNPDDSNYIDPKEVCNYYYYKDVETCNQGVNPSQGCVAFCQTDEECDLIRSYKVCERNINQTCENDADCLPSGGQCIYTNIEESSPAAPAPGRGPSPR